MVEYPSNPWRFPMPAYKDTKNNLWYVQFSIKGLDGKFHGKTKRGFVTKRDAIAWEMEEKRKTRGALDMLFPSFCELYIEKMRPRLKLSTFTNKTNIIYTHIIPYFKNKSVNNITSQDIMNWQTLMMNKINTKNDKSFSKSYLKTIHNQINAIFNFACKYYNLPVNPATVVGNMGTDREVEIDFWTQEQYLKFRDEMMDQPMFYYAFECLYWLGIREGEMLALTPSDFDFKNKTVSITKTFYILNGEHYITSPKTRKSIRTITVPDFLCDEIKEYLEFSYIDPEGEGRMFPTTKSSLTRAFRKGITKANLPVIRIHDLRHSHVSLLINLGYSAVGIAERLGHESIHVTYRYAHLFPTIQTEMANTLNMEMQKRKK